MLETKYSRSRRRKDEKTTRLKRALVVLAICFGLHSWLDVHSRGFHIFRGERDEVLRKSKSPRSKSLNCREDDLAIGSWQQKGVRIRIWHPKSCLLSLHHPGSVRETLRETQIQLVGGHPAKQVQLSMCSAQFGGPEACATKRVSYMTFREYVAAQFDMFETTSRSQQRVVTFIFVPGWESIITVAEVTSARHARCADDYPFRDCGALNVVLTTEGCSPPSHVNSRIMGLLNSTAVLCTAEVGSFGNTPWKVREASPATGILSNILFEKVRRASASHMTNLTPGSCALVTTAGYLTKFGNGGNIDAANHVIRVGAGPTEGYEKHVGSRTDLRILRHSTFDVRRGNSAFGANERILIIHDQVKHASEPLRHKSKKHLLYRQAIPYYNFERWQEHEPLKNTHFAKCLDPERDISTGFWSILLLLLELDLCNSLRLYGFLGHKFPGYPYHYFSMGLAGESNATVEIYASREAMKGGHNFKLEHECLFEVADTIDLRSDSLFLSDATVTNIRSSKV